MPIQTLINIKIIVILAYQLYLFKTIIIMMIDDLPSLEEIYDLSTDDLRKIIRTVETQLEKAETKSDLNEQYQNYIENINIEIQERKTLQFFQELCAIDNPYIKKVTDFNNQFLRLASEVISQQQGISGTDKNVKKNKKLDQIQQQFEYKDQEHQTNDGISIQSIADTNSRMTGNLETQNKSYTSEKAMTEKKMGIGSNKNRMKNRTKEFIMSTLSKNQAEGCYVVKKGGTATAKPQTSYTVNERGHLLNHQTMEPASHKSIKSNHSIKQKNTETNHKPNMKNQSSKINEKQLQKKRHQAFEKIKGNKSQSKKKEGKSNLNKYLVDMVKQQQKEKQIKKKHIQNDKPMIQSLETRPKQNHSQNKLQNAFQQVKQDKKKTETILTISPMKRQIISEVNKKPETLSIDSQNKNIIKQSQQKYEIKEQIEEQLEEQDKISNGNSSKEQQITEQIAQAEDEEKNQNQQQVKNKRQNSTEQNKQTFSMEKSNPANHVKQDQKRTQISKQKKLKQIHSSEHNIVKGIYSDECYKQLIKIKEQLKNDEQKQSKNKQDNFQRMPSDFGKITNEQDENDELIGLQKENKKQTSLKKCYNEEYWIHIREQAQFKIRRFKQEKELSERYKNQIISTIKNANQKEGKADQNIDGTQQTVEISERSSAEIHEVQDLPYQEDQFIERKKKQLNKMINEHNSRNIFKKAAVINRNIPKIINPLPEFNYLQIYPTFNHIFSVMYCKPQNQAINDIPQVMKDLTIMFSTHLSHFKDKGNYFQPAIFLPFDSINNFSMANPRQLLLQAENTYVNLKKIVQRLQTFNGNLHGQFNNEDNKYYRVVKTKEQVYDIITTAFLRRKGWKQLPHGCSLRASWNLFWSWSKPDIDLSKLLVWQRINHFPFNKNLSRKDLLYKNLDAFRKSLKISFPFLPLTFNLPKEFTAFSMKFHEQQILNRGCNYWIMKPIAKSRGRGIKVISNLSELNYTDNIVVQKYIANPLLLDGYKFDMRIYVLVTNFHPLEAFLYKQGFGRLSTQKFSMEPIFIKNTFVHLTNFSINKNNQQAKLTSQFSGGSKISLKVLKDKLTKMDYSFSNIWTQVQQIIVKSLLGCSVSVPSFPNAFELFGYDIMIDTDGACHLIQINTSPSLERSYMIDEIIKQALIDDIMDIVSPPDFDKQQLLDVLSERMLYKKKFTPEQDLTAIARILKYKKIRKFGEIPQNIGLFEMIAPGKLSTDLQKLIKGKSGANNPHNID